MAEPEKCTGVIDATHETIVLGLKLAGELPKDIDKFLINAVQSKEVQDAITGYLNEIAKDAVKNNKTTFSEAEAKKFGKELITRGVNATGQSVLGQVKKTTQYQKLEESAQNVLKSLKCSGVGVWFDKNQTMVYIVGAGVLLSGAVAMYVARSGDTVTEPAISLIKDKQVKFKLLGDVLQIGGGITKFTPSKRDVEIKTIVATDLKVVKAEFTITTHFIDTNVQVAGTGKVVIPITRDLTAKIEGAYDPYNAKSVPLSLGLGLEFRSGNVKLDLLGRIQSQDNKLLGSGSLGLGVLGNIEKMPFNANISGKVDTSGGVGVMGTFTLHWDQPTKKK
jgi:hypothetical protein